jgi:predicted nucleic acid binding AN1-type Zn finger protein
MNLTQLSYINKCKLPTQGEAEAKVTSKKNERLHNKKMEDDIKKMEDDIKKNNGRQPNKNEKMGDDLKKWKTTSKTAQ